MWFLPTAPGKRTKKLGCQLFFLLPGVNALLVLYGFKILSGLFFFRRDVHQSFLIEPQHAHFVLVDVGVNQGHNYPNMTLKRHKHPSS